MFNAAFSEPLDAVQESLARFKTGIDVAPMGVVRCYSEAAEPQVLLDISFVVDALFFRLRSRL